VKTKDQWTIVIVPARLEPSKELKDTTRIKDLQISTFIMNSLTRAGFSTVGEIRRATDLKLRVMRGIGPHSLRYLRETLGS
jgi:DNA-directed RNA polymerase alpha subunit